MSAPGFDSLTQLLKEHYQQAFTEALERTPSSLWGLSDVTLWLREDGSLVIRHSFIGAPTPRALHVGRFSRQEPDIYQQLRRACRRVQEALDDPGDD